jgi:hypothetical protein
MYIKGKAIATAFFALVGCGIFVYLNLVLMKYPLTDWAINGKILTDTYEHHQVAISAIPHIQ